MAAYAASVTLNHRRTQIFGSGLKIIYGSVNVSNYNQTLAEITDITDHFKGTPTVVIESVSDGGYWGTWVAASKAIKCWIQTGTAAAAAQLSSDTDAGAFNFIAIGKP